MIRLIGTRNRFRPRRLALLTSDLSAKGVFGQATRPESRLDLSLSELASRVAGWVRGRSSSSAPTEE